MTQAPAKMAPFGGTISAADRNRVLNKQHDPNRVPTGGASSVGDLFAFDGSDSEDSDVETEQIPKVPSKTFSLDPDNPFGPDYESHEPAPQRTSIRVAEDSKTYKVDLMSPFSTEPLPEKTVVPIKANEESVLNPFGDNPEADKLLQPVKKDLVLHNTSEDNALSHNVKPAPIETVRPSAAQKNQTTVNIFAGSSASTASTSSDSVPSPVVRQHIQTSVDNQLHPQYSTESEPNTPVPPGGKQRAYEHCQSGVSAQNPFAAHVKGNVVQNTQPAPKPLVRMNPDNANAQPKNIFADKPEKAKPTKKIVGGAANVKYAEASPFDKNGKPLPERVQRDFKANESAAESPFAKVSPKTRKKSSLVHSESANSPWAKKAADAAQAAEVTGSKKAVKVTQNPGGNSSISLTHTGTYDM